jgi:hypothetical protein
MQKKQPFNKKLLLIFALVLLIPSVCFGNGTAVAASEIDNPKGNKCRVVLTEYRPNSGVMYVGNCGWTGLKGIGAYVQGWNHSNHIKIVRGHFESGTVQSYAKVTYINKLEGTVQTYEESMFITKNSRQYYLADLLADANQSGLYFDNTVFAYIKFANYVDMRE